MKPLLLFLLLTIKLSAFSQTGKYVKADHNGCLIWIEEYTLKDSVNWKGGCKNGYAFGNGYVSWFKDNHKASTYSGQMKKGKPDGTGILKWYEDDKIVATYSGQVRNGVPNGIGKLTLINYATYVGNFKNGQLNGNGAAYFVTGGKTIGNFVDGNFLNLDKKYLVLLKKQYVNLKHNSKIYNSEDDKQLFYYALVPSKKITSALVLFPSTGESVENVISCNKVLMQQAYDHNIMTAVVSANYNDPLDSDKATMAFFETVFKDMVTRFNAPKDKFILSGLSLGGENALQYTEMSRNNSYDTFIKPLAVIGVDPPVDMRDLYYGAKKQISVYEKEGDNLSENKKIALKEDHFLVDGFTRLYGGSPDEFPGKYISGSQFSRSEEDGGNAKFLVNVPVRLYCDPDIVWQLKNKGRDYYEMNAANLSAMVNFLMQKGNAKAELIPAIGKGYRVDGTRHPHSWSIVEPLDCVKWILGLVNKNKAVIELK